jgi:hypothetical protein
VRRRSNSLLLYMVICIHVITIILRHFSKMSFGSGDRANITTFQNEMWSVSLLKKTRCWKEVEVKLHVFSDLSFR